jgi:hypothetical protein
MTSSIARFRNASLALVIAASPLLAQTNHNEVEPNSNKAESTVPAFCLSPGDTLNGLTTGTSTTAGSTLATTVDYWRVQTCTLPPGIYRHQLVLTTGGTAGHTGTVRGLNQTGTVGVGGTAGTADTVLQTSSTTTTPPRMNQWYGFGKGEQFYYRVAGTTSTTANYVSTFEAGLNGGGGMSSAEVVAFINARRAVGAGAPDPYTGSDLKAELRTQRMLDLYFAGYRVPDLIRYQKQGVDLWPKGRIGGFPADASYTYGTTTCLPIANSELTANPNARK